MERTEAAPQIVVGIDGSQSSISALREARRLARSAGASVLALTVWERPALTGSVVQGGASTSAAEASATLTEVRLKVYGHHSLAESRSMVVHGDPRAVLVRASLTALMLVIGRRGFGSLYGLNTGTVSSACVAYSHCPVLVVHNPTQRDESAKASRLADRRRT